MKKLLQNEMLRKAITFIAGASIGLSADINTKFPNFSAMTSASYSKQVYNYNTIKGNPKSIEYMINFQLIPKKSAEDTNEKQDEELKAEYISEHELNDYINKVYKKIKVPAYIDRGFLRALIQIESGRNIHAISPKGARGLMQLLPDAWNEVNNSDFYKDWSNPQKNIEVGIKYLKWINDYCNHNYAEWEEIPIQEKQSILAAAYNGGIGLLEKKEWNINQMPNETTNYVDTLRTSQAKTYSDSTKAD